MSAESYKRKANVFLVISASNALQCSKRMPIDKFNFLAKKNFYCCVF